MIAGVVRKTLFFFHLYEQVKELVHQTRRSKIDEVAGHFLLVGKINKKEMARALDKLETEKASKV